MGTARASTPIAMLLFLLDQAFDHRAWHGTNLRGSLRGLSAHHAAWRFASGRHNIWELALHCAYWKYCVCRLLLGQKRGGFPIKGSNFFVRSSRAQTGDQNWRAELTLLEEQHRRLRAAVAAFPPARLSQRASPNGWSYSAAIVGAASHDLYHAGQIQLLKRLLKQRRAR